MAAILVLLAVPSALRADEDRARSPVRFREVSSDWGLDFVHHNGASGRRYMVETMVGGVVVLDYDGDGDQDVFFVDGGELPGYEAEDVGSELFRNEGGGRFVEVTARSRIRIDEYGVGGVSGDTDGDGDVELFVATFDGRDRIFENRGDGTFADVTARVGIVREAWSSSATFTDGDRDGDLDLYVTGYLDFTVEKHKDCEFRDAPGYCHPDVYPSLPDLYYRNRGDGVFREATAEAGLSGPRLAGLGVAAGDLDRDGWPDLYVANDFDPNLFFKSEGGGVWEDFSLLSGTAYSDRGRPEAGMGVDFGDVDGDGLEEILVTNFDLESNGLYRNLGDGFFADARFSSGISDASFTDLGFGIAFHDLDLDGDLDIFVVNGHVQDNARFLSEDSRFAQTNRVLLNDGSGKFTIVEAGLDVVRVSRGLAMGDLDGDGDGDAVVLNAADRAEAWENVTPEDASWIQVDLRSEESNRLGVDARLELWLEDRLQVREVRTGSSYLSQSSLTRIFGLGDASEADRLEVRWPSGKRQRFRDLRGSRRYRFHEERGTDA
ncbi:MAG: CRTAC1 family protein [Thermoanaerobaculia bacterium]|nr:CRTAC1 family protein [Thermoanaerobaculia bacterium]